MITGGWSLALVVASIVVGALLITWLVVTVALWLLTALRKYLGLQP